VAHVAKQIGVPAAELAFYDFTGRTAKRHRSALRRLTGWHECGVNEQVKLTAHLSGPARCDGLHRRAQTRDACRADHPGYRAAEAALGLHQPWVSISAAHRNGAIKFTEPAWADVLTDWRVTWHLVGCS
jgi:hypothetical protein